MEQEVPQVEIGDRGRGVSTGLPAALPAPARRALESAGYSHLEQLSQVNEADLKRLHGVGPKAIRVVRAALEAVGMSLAES